MYARKGFTLIELSIVLVIIGLITGGVLVGRELILAAQLRKIIKQQDQFSEATQTFRSKYNCLPGNCLNATDYGFAVNGSGSGIVGDLGSSDVQQVDFWNQLAVAGLISGSYHDSTQPPLSTVVNHYGLAGLDTPSVDLPQKAIYTGWMLWCDTIGPFNNYVGYPGWSDVHAFVIASGGEVVDDAATGAVLPQYAQSIDAKIDDGLPTTGNVRGFGRSTNSEFDDECDPEVYSNFISAGGASSNNCISNSTSPDSYNLQGTKPACMLIMKATF